LNATASRDASYILGIERPDTAASLAPLPAAAPGPASPAKKRLKIWQIRSGWLCSVVGTCLTASDVERITRRCGLSFPGDVQTYDIHGFMVARASERDPVAREIARTLDDRHAAILHKVGAERDQARLAALWDDLCGRGLIAGAYWAIMSHTHVAEPLKMHAFGEIHMLSHFMGGCNRHNVKELWLAQRRLDQLADAVAKARRQSQETIAARDLKISDLQHELSTARHQLARSHGSRSTRSPGPAPVTGPHGRGGERGGRRLAAARARLAALEAENQRLQALLGVLIETGPPRPTMAPQPDATGPVAEEGAPQLEGRCILYVGGRCQLLPHLRARAASWKASLLYHDGGQEESLQSLGRLVDRADFVLCPIDCVSHQACLKVKGLCRRRAKPFVPLRSSSATCFARAIRALQGAAG
jgi:Uncharacterized protein conserved in bacteria (DUF2325)